MEKYILQINNAKDKNEIKGIVKSAFNDRLLSDNDFNNLIYEYVIPILNV